jgi:Protein of unknown function (DUF2877)
MVARHAGAPGLLAARSWDVLARDLVSAQSAWRVHSAFPRAFNLVTPDGDLLGVVSTPAGNGPATIVLEPATSGSTFDSLLTRGDPARLTGQWLVFSKSLVVDLGRVELWDPAPIRRERSAPEIECRLARVARIASDLAPTEGLSPLLHEAFALAGGSVEGSESAHADLLVAQARGSLARLTAAIRERRWSAALSAARELSGLGPGLTPSGDDLLAGLALGLHAGLGSMPRPLCSALRLAVEGRTTDLAVARVRHALAGHADEAVHTLLATIVDGIGEGLDGAVKAALDYGHSSGPDTLVGLIVGLSLGIAPRP